MQQKDIAELAGCSPGIVRYSLREAGIPLRPRRAAGELARSVDPAWLRLEYHVKGRTAADIGRELGTGGGSVTNLLDAWGILVIRSAATLLRHASTRIRSMACR